MSVEMIKHNNVTLKNKIQLLFTWFSFYAVYLMSFVK